MRNASRAIISPTGRGRLGSITIESENAYHGSMGFRDQTVVITGAAGGIGSALARRFAREGARVALLDRESDGIETLAVEIEAQGTSALPVRCDVTSLPDCEAALASVIGAFGGVDLLVNNAGITHLKAALASLLERRGRIVVISSVAGIAPLATRTGYAASKYALHGFFESLRAEHVGDGLRVMLVCPSFVDTAIGDRALGTDGGPAQRAARTGARNRRLLLVGRQATLSRWIAMLAPTLYERLMIRRTLLPGNAGQGRTGSRGERMSARCPPWK
jgi:NAD(P)-dependent dehydrogenase (short-subunit alcohol dehydrogenase family)